MKTNRTGGIIAGTICFSVFMIPWLYLIYKAFKTDPHGFRAETNIGITIGVLVFAFVSSFLGFSIAKKSVILVIIASIFILAVPAIWWQLAWLP
jgi:hypothetical protein